VALGYTIPLTRWDTTLSLGFDRSDSPVVEEPFADLDIRSRTESYALGIRQPIWRTVDTELAASLTLVRRDNKSFLAGEPFSFSPGAEDGASAVTALRFAQELVTRRQEWALSLRSTFSFGIDAFDPTIHGGGLPDSHFFAWLGQWQYVRRLPVRDWQLILRGAAQLTPDPLLPLEQFSLGGMDTVRGYRENQLVRDIGVAATAEVRVPLYVRQEERVLDLAVFFDAGYARNNGIEGVDNPGGEFVASAGLGVLWNPHRRFSATVYWGYPFNDFEQTSDDLQDLGFHFSLVASWP
jgi:hemolysin activation/secretion protein